MSPEEPVDSIEVKTADDLFRQGWIQHSRDKEEQAAEESFRRAITLDHNKVDAYYGLGLVQKAQGKHREAVDTFQTVVEKIESGMIDDRVRSEMLRRLTLGHINMLKSGDWGLEEEIWQHEE